MDNKKEITSGNDIIKNNINNDMFSFTGEPKKLNILNDILLIYTLLN